MLPAPRKPTPVTTPWTMRVGSNWVMPKSRIACGASSTNMVDPRHTSTWVRRPAGLRPIWRSNPTTVPSRVEISMAMASCMEPPFSGSRTAGRPDPLLPVETRRALLQERCESLAGVLGRGHEPEQRALEPQPLIEGHREPGLHRLERRRDRDRPVLEDLRRQRDRLVDQPLPRHHAVDDPEPLGLLGLDRAVPPGEDHLQRTSLADEARKALRPAVAGDDAERGLGQAHHR